MPAHGFTSAGTDQHRLTVKALASLREAEEFLELAAAADEHSNLGIASALSHVGAARKALRPTGASDGRAAPERDAA